MVFSDVPASPGTTYYDLTLGSVSPPRNSLYGVPVRADVPNAPKKGQLDLASPVFRALVPLTGLRTVHDVFTRIAQMTHVELYADAREEKKTLTIVGTTPFVPASDLMRAVALCLTATFRQVGPAFLLTDDVVGVGTRRQLWREFSDDAAALREAALEAAGDKLSAGHSLMELSGTKNPLTMTADQQAKADQVLKADGFLVDPGVRLDDLTPAQQQALLNTAPISVPGVGTYKPDLTRTVQLQESPVTELLVPSLDGPVRMRPGLVFLFQSGASMRKSISDMAGDDPPAPPPGTTTAPLPALFAAIPRRALLVAPGADLKVSAAAMGALHLNQLWVPVFYGGAFHPDALNAALAAAKGTGVAVYSVLDLLDGGEASPIVPDVTILSETSVQAAARRTRRTAIRDAGAGTVSSAARPPLYVSPFNSVLRDALRTAVTALAANPDVAGLVWRATDPPGYDLPEQEDYFDTNYQLGYTPGARLAFLRRYHADPLDVYSTERHSDADTSLPNFDDPVLDGQLNAEWRHFRAERDVTLLRGLYDAASAAGKAPAILIRQRRNGPISGWFGSWDGPQAPLPTYTRYKDARAQAKAQSRTALVRLPFSGALTATTLAARWRRAFEQMAQHKVWDGFVLDMGGD